MIIRYTLSDENATPSKEQIEEIERAKKRPIVYDDDCPEMTPELEKAFLVSAAQRNRLKRKRA